MSDFPELPPAVPKPCNDCPWRRNAAQGWLGPYSAEKWVELAHSEAPIACHQTIPKDVGQAEWDDPVLRQCMGAAIFRVHAIKNMRNPTDAQHEAQADREHVFDDILGRDFIAFHTAADRTGPASEYQQAMAGYSRGGQDLDDQAQD